MTDLLTKTGEPKLVEHCTYPLTGVGCVTRVYTDHAVFGCHTEGFAVREAFGDNTVESLAQLTGLRLEGGGSRGCLRGDSRRHPRPGRLDHAQSSRGAERAQRSDHAGSVAAASAFDSDPDIGAIVVTGSERAFAAGADVKEMENASGVDMLLHEPFAEWSRFASLRTPVIAAVSGYALGGGCELVMMCDVVLAVPRREIRRSRVDLAVIPGMGGTQRLVRAVGYYKAAELVLTGRIIDAQEAERIGLVSRVVKPGELLLDAERTANTMASKCLPALYAAKAALDAALDSSLAEGAPRVRVLGSLFDTADQKEGMAAFREKRSPAFRHR